MTKRIEEMLDYFVNKKEHHTYRQKPLDPYRYAEQYQREGLTDLDRSVKRLHDILAEEKPIVFPFEKISFIRTVPVLPEIFTKNEFLKISSEHYIHEQGKVCNIAPQYSLILNRGFAEIRKEIADQKNFFENKGDIKRAAYEQALIDTIDIILEFTNRYQKEAERVGNSTVAEILKKIPNDKPSSFLEALQFLRIIHYCLWCSFNYHNTLGRFDQYMYPYYRKDIDNGVITKETALELIEEFFLSLNRDSDLYTGMQQGDNGQSMVLGGLNKDGTDSFNDLSDLCLTASRELKLIDPKINLRVSHKTPLSIYIKGTELTKKGIGFPQYANDDVVFKALKRWGYDDDDAVNYVVAACWEFIIPGYGMDIPNLNSLCFPDCVISAIKNLKKAATFDDLMNMVRANIKKECDRLRSTVKNIYMEPAPLLSLLMYDTIKNAKDISMGNKYNNYGFHGTGLSTAVDSLAAIKKYVYDTKKLDKDRLLRALNTNFENEEDLKTKLRYEAPKMGNDDDSVDAIAVKLLDWYADSLEGYKNDRGGIYRAGTGSAMYYIWQSKNEPATPDGRNKGEEFAANYSPSIFTKLNGPISIIKSFAKPHLYRVANGGPLTIELTDSMFRNAESVEKTAMFVKTFIDLGGHQLQINAVNRDELLDAKKHPEKHRNLIVRVWGWSGYFVELDECYQNHILKRMELTV